VPTGTGTGRHSQRAGLAESNTGSAFGFGLLREAGIVGHGRKLRISSRPALILGRDVGAITAAPPLKGFLPAEGGKFRLTLGSGVAVGFDERRMAPAHTRWRPER
jgi:hypothetical protein